MSSPESESFDPQRRRLCPDGACLGLIGADGRCRMCGAADPGGPPAAGLSPEAFGGGCASELDEQDQDRSQDDALAAGAGALDAGGGFDPHRALCPDGACLGVLGTSGRCNICGRGAEG